MLLEDHDLYSGLIRLHVLHHAAQEPIFGLGMIEELARHGYRISPGTMYPLLQRWKRRAICVPPRGATENRGARYTARRRWAEKPWPPRKTRFANCFTNSSRGINAR